MIFKSHFTFTKKQRNGIFLLIIVIVGVQIAYYIYKNNIIYTEDTQVDSQKIQQDLDSLKRLQTENQKPKIFPFNPNFITDYKGYTLGMSNEEIDRLHQFRSQDKWVNSKADFQSVTKISDSLLAAISPYFKFPEWVTNPKPKTYTNTGYSNKPKTFEQKIDLNIATAAQFKRVYGVGEKLSERIVTYRNKIEGGFIADVQLTEVYGLSPEVIERIQEQFTVKTPKQITKIVLNTASRDQLVKIQYIDYEVAFNIIEQRTLRDGYKSLDDLTKVKDFPTKKIEIIKLYLTLN